MNRATRFVRAGGDCVGYQRLSDASPGCDNTEVSMQRRSARREGRRPGTLAFDVLDGMLHGFAVPMIGQSRSTGASEGGRGDREPNTQTSAA